jgi:hypothetical protein
MSAKSSSLTLQRSQRRSERLIRRPRWQISRLPTAAQRLLCRQEFLKVQAKWRLPRFEWHRKLCSRCRSASVRRS